MQRWAYMIINTTIGSGNYPDARAWFAHLVELGNEGWEVVGMITLSDNELPTDGLLAKRPRD